MDRKIKVLVVPSDNGGCRTWRMTWPHSKLDDLYYDKFEVTINDNPDWRNLSYFDQFDIMTFHKGIFQDNEGFLNCLLYCKEKNIVTVMDIDDYWHLGQFHPQNLHNEAIKAPERTVTNLRLVDYVTTTTQYFADEIAKINKNVEVFPNAIDTEDPQWFPDYSKADKIRFGFVMGSSHERDMQQFVGAVAKLPSDVVDKVQIVLCGYDLRGVVTMIDKDGKVTGNRPIEPKESVWYKYEQIVTDNYNKCDPAYRDFLEKFLPNVQYPNVETKFYRREWTKDLNSFGTHYNNIDVLLVPLDDNKFNSYKSELKMVEAGFKHKGIVMSNYGPYTIGSKSIFERNGEINREGNCVLIDPMKAHKDWARTIIKLTREPELITLLQDNLYNHVKDRYNLDTVTKKRAEWYEKIVKKS